MQFSAKKIVLLVSSILGFGFLTLSFFSLITKTKFKNKRIIKSYSNIISKLIKKNNIKLLNIFLQLISNIPFVISVSLSTQNKTYSTNKTANLPIISSDSNFYTISEVVYDKNNEIGVLQIDYKK